MRTLRLDMHTHLKAAKRVAFEPAAAVRYARALTEQGLDGLAITEHVHAPGFWEMYDALGAEHRYLLGRYEIGGALLYSGFELTLAEVVDVLFIGPLPELRRLDRAFPTPLSQGHHPTGEELAETLDRLDPHLLRIAAHPFRATKRVHRIPPGARRRIFHAAEINSTLACEHDWEQVHDFVAREGLAVTGGSDAHTTPQVGAAWTEAAAASDAFDDLFDSVAGRSTLARVAPDVHDRVTAGRLLKARIKAQAPKLPRVEARPARARVA